MRLAFEKPSRPRMGNARAYLRAIQVANGHSAAWLTSNGNTIQPKGRVALTECIGILRIPKFLDLLAYPPNIFAFPDLVAFPKFMSMFRFRSVPRM